jgi:hypothetical protein
VSGWSAAALGQRGNRLCPLALACASHAEVQLRDRQVWLLADDALEQRDGDAEGAVFNGDDRGMQRVRQRNAIFRIDPADCGRTTRPADVSERRQPLGDFGKGPRSMRRCARRRQKRSASNELFEFRRHTIDHIGCGCRRDCGVAAGSAIRS